MHFLNCVIQNMSTNRLQRPNEMQQQIQTPRSIIKRSTLVSLIVLLIVGGGFEGNKWALKTGGLIKAIQRVVEPRGENVQAGSGNPAISLHESQITNREGDNNYKKN